MVDEVYEQARRRTGPLAVILIDDGGVVRSWSAGAQELFGFDATEVLGRDVADLIVPEPLRDQHRLGVRAMRERGPSPSMGGTYTRPARDASDRHFPVELTLVDVSVGSATWTAGIARSLSDPTVDEAVPPLDALVAVFERAPEAITVLDAQGRQVTVNKSGAAMFGYGSGRHPGDGYPLVHPDDRRRLDDFGSGLRNGTIAADTPIRYRVLSGDGRWRWLETLIADLTDVPGVEGRVAFSRDVTEDEQRRIDLDDARRLAERTSEELRTLAEARLTFAASVSHELRTPLTSISSVVETLRSSVPLDPGDTELYLSILDRNTRRLARLVEDLLMFSRAESGLLQLFPEPVDHLDVVTEAAEPLRQRGNERGIRIDIEGDAGLEVDHDPDRVVQIVQNLVDNAVKYAVPSSTVSVRSSVDDGTWTVAVENRGRPIDPAEVDGIFQPFFRTSHERLEAEGAGLGLALARRIAELAGGSLECDLTVRDGARFVVSLPAAQPVDAVALGR